MILLITLIKTIPIDQPITLQYINSTSNPYISNTIEHLNNPFIHDKEPKSLIRISRNNEEFVIKIDRDYVCFDEDEVVGRRDYDDGCFVEIESVDDDVDSDQVDGVDDDHNTSTGTPTDNHQRDGQQQSQELLSKTNHQISLETLIYKRNNYLEYLNKKYKIRIIRNNKCWTGRELEECDGYFIVRIKGCNNDNTNDNSNDNKDNNSNGDSDDKDNLFNSNDDVNKARVSNKRKKGNNKEELENKHKTTLSDPIKELVNALEKDLKKEKNKGWGWKCPNWKGLSFSLC